MTNFMDLPKPVREKIYRLHLVAEKQPVDFEAYKKTCGYTESEGERPWGIRRPTELKCPSLLQVSRKVEREASPIYFGENTFCLRDATSLRIWKWFTLLRHIRQVRKIAFSAFNASHRSLSASDFTPFNKLPKLESLTICVNEEKEIKNVIRYFEWKPTNRRIKWHPSLGFGPQVGLQMLRFDGVPASMLLRGLNDVKYVKDLNISSDDLQNMGSIPGGFLETTVKKDIMQPRSSQESL